jgi:hypothetical protein
MNHTRRGMMALFAAFSGSLQGQVADFPDEPSRRRPDESPNHEQRLPNGKSQSDAIAKKQHEDSLKDATQMVILAEQIRDELQKAGDYVVPLSTVKKTEEIEKLARKIRGRLKT